MGTTSAVACRRVSSHSLSNNWKATAPYKFTAEQLAARKQPPLLFRKGRWLKSLGLSYAQVNSYSLYKAVYFVLRYFRNTEGSKGEPVTAFINSSPLGCTDPTSWIFFFSQFLSGLKLPAAISFSMEGISSLAFCTQQAQAMTMSFLEHTALEH